MMRREVVFYEYDCKPTDLEIKDLVRSVKTPGRIIHIRWKERSRLLGFRYKKRTIEPFMDVPYVTRLGQDHKYRLVLASEG